MFPDIVRDDVFRLETRRLWLRWPRAADAPAIQRYSSKWEVVRYTARIPHPYPPGEAERYIFAARQANAAGHDLIMAITSHRDKSAPFGMISVESRLEGRLTLGYALAPEAWGKGYASEATRAIVDASFLLTHAVEILATARIENPASRRVLEKCGFVRQGAGREGAPARGGLVDVDRFKLERSVWAVDYGQRTAVIPPIDAA
jgi:RimJ/RimL family protein N-acetyltransferase